MRKGKKQTGDLCIICGHELASSTAAKASHLRKHVRDGSLEETMNKAGKLVWTSTGKEPHVKEKHGAFICHYSSKAHFEPRKPAAAKSAKNGDVYIRCKVCDTWKSAMITKDIIKDNKIKKDVKMPADFADPRFVCVTCCDKITPFPKRVLGRVMANPGKEYKE